MADSPRSPASFEAFLKNALERYWTTRRNQVHFVALLLASREAWEVAWDGLRAPATGRRLLGGAAGATAVLVALRLFVGGPIGLVLTGASVAGLATVYARNHKTIWERQERYRRLIGEYRARYDQVRADWIEGRIDEAQSELMFDGLLNRLLDDIDAG
jgi:predicted aminopeptidase